MQAPQQFRIVARRPAAACRTRETCAAGGLVGPDQMQAGLLQFAQRIQAGWRESEYHSVDVGLHGCPGSALSASGIPDVLESCSAFARHGSWMVLGMALGTFGASLNPWVSYIFLGVLI